MAADNTHIDYEKLVERYQQGEQQALKVLILEFHPRLCRTIGYYTGDSEPVDDLAQECWYDIIRELTYLQLKISFSAWALTIARRKAIDWIRQQQRNRKKMEAVEQQSRTDSNNHADEEQGRLHKVRKGISQLPESQRIVLKMFYLDNLSINEIGQVLEISVGTVKSRLYYAREELKELIDN
ncbi:MAG: RNA polymerase sigma factor [Balneolaceae bacterium]|nr:RNA polymerase sigma factor [Balneolaceae bacterium]